MRIYQHLRPACMALAALCLSMAAAGPASATITIATVPVGNAGNAADPSTTFGAVSYNYNIGKYDVTEGQYTAFLNAVATTSDTYSLYKSAMATDFYNSGITQSGSAGSYTYATSTPNFPVTEVSFWSATRFANWLSNGQPTGPEGSSTTENGTYTLTSTGISNNTVTRNANATWAVVSENEWYKAAYYSPANSSYSLYPTQSNSQPSNVESSTGTNNANYYNIVYTDPTYYLTPVGYFAGSPGAYQTFDQGGNVFQWNDTIISGSDRGARGGSWDLSNVSYLQSSYRGDSGPTYEGDDIGFRVSLVPEPAFMGLIGLGAIGMFRRRRGVRR